MFLFDRFFVDINKISLYDSHLENWTKFNSLRTLYHHVLSCHINSTPTSICLRNYYKDLIIGCNIAGNIQTGRSPIGFKSMGFVIPHQRQSKRDSDRELRQSGHSELLLTVAGWSGPYIALIQEDLIQFDDEIISIAKFPKIDNI